MSCLHVTLGLLRHHLRQPLGWLLVAALLLSWPALRTFLPLGLVTADLHHWTGAYEVAFMGGLAAMAMSLSPLNEFCWIMRPLGPLGKIAVQTGSLILVSAGAGLLALVPAHLFYDWQIVSFQAEDSLPALVLAWAHAAVIGVVLLQLPLERHLRAAIAVGLVTVVPGLVTGETAAGHAILAWFDVGETLRASFEFSPTRAHWIGAALPMTGWFAGALALASPGDVGRPTHAIRNPR
ncbi:hypothetical protein N9Z54_00560 [Planctomycetota bacterium]|nr:hypothetical protein [Planctomycetota bacterium]